MKRESVDFSADSTLRLAAQAWRAIKAGVDPAAAAAAQGMTLEALHAETARHRPPERVRERLAACSVLDAFVPLWMRDENGRWSFNAGAVSVVYRDRLWLLTAAHALEDPWHGEVRVPLRDTLLQLRGRRFRLRPPRGTSRALDPGDAAVIACEWPCDALLAEWYPPVELHDRAQDHPVLAGTTLTVCGLPANTVKWKRGTQRGILKSFTSSAAEPSSYGKIGCDPLRNVLMETKPKAWRNQRTDQIETQGPMNGVSGGPILLWPPQGVSEEQGPKLIGIATFWSDSKRVMGGTRMEVYAEMIDQRFPVSRLRQRHKLLRIAR